MPSGIESVCARASASVWSMMASIGASTRRAVALDQLDKAPLAGGEAVSCAAQIAHRAIGEAHIHADDVDDVVVELAGARWYFTMRDLQALGIDVGGDPVERAADVQPVRHAAGEARPACRRGRSASEKVRWLRWLPVM